MGNDESHFNVSLTVRDKVTRQCPQTTIREKRVVSPVGSLRCSGLKLSDLRFLFHPKWSGSRGWGGGTLSFVCLFVPVFVYVSFFFLFLFSFFFFFCFSSHLFLLIVRAFRPNLSVSSLPVCLV